ncbi:MAG: hypothetical protein EBT50_08790, partial [Verrucomicrobia bacterium]|nr:hypothetical protein [Verrucomicrobiota bacterium]
DLPRRRPEDRPTYRVFERKSSKPVKLKNRNYVLINIIHFSEPALGAGARGFWKKTSPKFPWGVFVSVFLFGSGLSFGQTNLSSYNPGTTYWGRSNYTEYIAGNLPLIISAPHGGDTNPAELPNRTNTSTYTVTTDPDLWTANLARAIRTAAFNRYGRYPHVIICRVDRAKVDCNRDIIEGAQNNTNTQTLWREFHAFLNIARQHVTATATPSNGTRSATTSRIRSFLNLLFPLVMKMDPRSERSAPAPARASRIWCGDP